MGGAIATHKRHSQSIIAPTIIEAIILDIDCIKIF